MQGRKTGRGEPFDDSPKISSPPCGSGGHRTGLLGLPLFTGLFRRAGARNPQAALVEREMGQAGTFLPWGPSKKGGRKACTGSRRGFQQETGNSPEGHV